MKFRRIYYHRWDTRLIKRFAVFPIEIHGEVRWLEKVTIEQEWTPKKGWRNKRFVDEQEAHHE